MNYDRIKELTQQIKVLERELEFERALALEEFMNMDQADLALCENKLERDGVAVTYYPPTTATSVDSAKLKKEGLYEQYTKVSNKKGYIKVNVKGDE